MKMVSDTRGANVKGLAVSVSRGILFCVASVGYLRRLVVAVGWL